MEARGGGARGVYRRGSLYQLQRDGRDMVTVTVTHPLQGTKTPFA